MGAGGRPTSYKPEYCEQAFKFCLMGATNEQLADFFGVCIDTICEWMKVHEKFSESIKDGRERADAEIGKALYHRAKGYTHKAVKIFNHEGEPLIVPYEEHYPPDTAAAFIWLKNRQGKTWRDKSEVEVSINEDLANRLEQARTKSDS